MARPRTYGRDEILASAMQAFWADGYHATSVRELADVMGVNVSAIYTEFGSKDGLYLAALEMYERDIVEAFFGPLEAPDASIATVRATLRQFPAMARSVPLAPGCLVTNAAIERAPDAGLSEDVMARYVERIGKGFTRALTRTLVRDIDRRAARRLSRQLVATLIGMFVMARAQIAPSVLDDVVASAVRQVDDFAAEHGISLSG